MTRASISEADRVRRRGTGLTIYSQTLSPGGKDHLQSSGWPLMTRGTESPSFASSHLSCRNQPQAINIAGRRQCVWGALAGWGQVRGGRPACLMGWAIWVRPPGRVGISAKAGEGLSLRPSEREALGGCSTAGGVPRSEARSLGPP